jgi:D-alanyl-D-alanine carboxypeptidase (penicillin-binding protein 5/6)
MRTIDQPEGGLVRRGVAVLVLLVLIGALAVPIDNYQRPLPSVWVTSDATAFHQVPLKVDVRWPSWGEAAIGIGDGGVVAATANQRPMPTASTAKIMTALIVVERRPLAPGEQGATITITAADQAAYARAAGQGQSSVPVVEGEVLTEYQALQALLLPSANNIAELLARWASGSFSEGIANMNRRAAQLGLRKTHFADASGFDPDTVSTAADLVVLAQAAMRHPVLAEIVGQRQAVLPIAGTVSNVNTMLGQDGIVGIKTGNTDEAGGCFVFAAPADPKAGDRGLIVGALMGMPDLGTALASSPALIDDARQALARYRIVEAGDVVGHYRTAWGPSTELVVSSGLDLPLWQGTVVRSSVELKRPAPPVAAGARVGTLTVAVDGAHHELPVRARTALPAPDWRWRLVRHS